MSGTGMVVKLFEVAFALRFRRIDPPADPRFFITVAFLGEKHGEDLYGRVARIEAL